MGQRSEQLHGRNEDGLSGLPHRPPKPPSVTFDCPQCGQVCAFDGQYIGRRARCTRCSQRFIIPDRDGARAQVVKEERPRPVPGFYKAVGRSWEVFTRRESLTGTLFIAALVVFRFFLAHMDHSIAMPGFTLPIPTGWIAVFITWGCQLWYYAEVLQDTALDYDEMLESELGTGLDFIWTMIKTIYFFFCAAIVAELPFLMLAQVLQKMGIHSPWILTPVLLGGAVIFPMVVLVLVTGREIYEVFRPDYVVGPIVCAPRPYAVVALLVAAAALLEWFSRLYGQLPNGPSWLIGLHLVGNLAAAGMGLFAMRALGLFARHYPGCLPWMMR